MSRLKIGEVTLENNVILAPMAGVTDLPFRCLCLEQGAGMVSMEMVSAKAIYYGNKGTEELLTVYFPEEEAKPLTLKPSKNLTTLQLFGSDPEIVAEMARRIEDRPFAVLDFNMGCPVPKVVNNGEGSALMKNPALAEKLLSALLKAVKKPVTVKIRKGFGEHDRSAVELARIAESCGVAAITVHGRTREQYYSGQADWSIIRDVKEAVKIPVIGNGDIISAQTAADMLQQTGCDGIMIGRAAQGNPWIFREVVRYLEEGVLIPRPDRTEMKAMIIRHAGMMREFKGEYTAVREMRKHLSWYTAGIPHSARFRQMINRMESMDELLGSVERIFTEHPANI